MFAILDASAASHRTVAQLFRDRHDHWVLPSATLPELDYQIAKRLGTAVQLAWLGDLATRGYAVDWGEDHDLVFADQLCHRYQDLHLGLVDSLVIATAVRLKADAIATLDLRHFATVAIPGRPKLLPRDSE